MYNNAVIHMVNIYFAIAILTDTMIRWSTSNIDTLRSLDNIARMFFPENQSEYSN